MNRRMVAGAALLLAGAAAGFAIAVLLPGSPETASAGSGERAILYWTDPMIPGFKADGPGKSPMGMELTPVYADEAAGAGKAAATSLRIDPAVISNIGVRTAAVERSTLYRRVETVGYVGYDDDKVADIDVRVDGWVEDLGPRTEGEEVRRGDLLFRLYSRPLVGAQAEYLQALRLGQSTIIEAAAERLAALGMTDGQIADLRKNGKGRERIDIRAPQDGFVVALDAREGAFVKPGTPVMRLGDLSTVWVQTEVHEQQIGWIEVGQTARMTLAFAPGEDWRGRVDYVYPTVRAKSRTGQVRLVFDNPGLRLKPGMYASVVIEVSPRENALHVPREALIRTGRSERVILALGEGRFRPAEVRSGIESGDRVEILEGLAEGEQVVTSGQFLIDSEASLNASFLRMLGREGAEEHRHD